MSRSRHGPVCRIWLPFAALLLFLSAPGGAMAQTTAPDDYYEICRRLGFIPGTTPMRRCVTMQRANDLDPMNALTEHDLIPPATESPWTGEGGLVGNLPGATSAEELLKRSPEALLLGPDYRSRSQGIYE